MKFNKIFLAFLALFVSGIQVLNAQVLSEESEITVITCAPGGELYSTFGHTAIRVKDPQIRIDNVYNYGTFNFNTPNFYLKFVRGQLDYMLTVSPYKYFVISYMNEKRWIKEQVLNLDLNQKSVLITGGTGSFGKEFVKTVLSRFPQIKKLVVFSRDELKQFEMSQVYPKSTYNAIRYFIGDVRDLNRLKRAFEGIDIVIHAAALKQIPAAEYNPIECIKTNILGAENVIEAALDNGVKRVIALSTDKAAAPINLYGATKLCSDKLFVAANNMKGKRDIIFSVVRYGNVMGSRGSVIPYFLSIRKSGTIPITHPDMTRFNISLEEGVNLVLYAIEHSVGGEIFVPKLPSYKILDLAEAIAPSVPLKTVGIRPGEKLHEDMITENDAPCTIEFSNYFIILPGGSHHRFEEVIKKGYGKKVKPEFRYNSGLNDDWLSVEDLRKLIKHYVDPTFEA